jgi:hypothetical protein
MCDDVDEAGDVRKDVLSLTGSGGMFAHTGCIDCLDTRATISHDEHSNTQTHDTHSGEYHLSIREMLAANLRMRL